MAEHPAAPARCTQPSRFRGRMCPMWGFVAVGLLFVLAAAAELAQDAALIQVGRTGLRMQHGEDAGESGAAMVCYFTNWARYRSGLINQGKDLFELGVDPKLCTHFMYGFVEVTTGFDLRSSDPKADYPSGSELQDRPCPRECNDPTYTTDWNDPSSPRCEWPCSPSRLKRGFEGLTVGMKKENPAIKALASVGGWNFNDCIMGSSTCEIFSTIAATEEATRSFAQKAIAFCRKWGFDGLDIDWEYPAVANHNRADLHPVKADYANYVRMLRILREEFATEDPSSPLLLTAAVGVGRNTVVAAYNIPEMSKHLDLINLMAYDLHGTWENTVACHASLHATQEDAARYGYPLSVAWAVDYWLQHGAPASKLTMGLGLYGRGWKLADPAKSQYGAAGAGACAGGTSTGEPGYRSYYEVQELLRSGSATRHYDSQRECPYVVTVDGEWIGYDDEQSFRAKVDFLKSRGLRGAMVWALDLDDFLGAYSDSRAFPLVSLVRSSLNALAAPTTHDAGEYCRPLDVCGGWCNYDMYFAFCAQKTASDCPRPFCTVTGQPGTTQSGVSRTTAPATTTGAPAATTERGASVLAEVAPGTGLEV